MFMLMTSASASGAGYTRELGETDFLLRLFLVFLFALLSFLLL